MLIYVSIKVKHLSLFIEELDLKKLRIIKYTSNCNNICILLYASDISASALIGFYLR